MKIFLVEDEKAKRFALQRALEKDGHEVIPYDTGEEALQDLKREAPDLLILDVRLPGMDGLEFLRRAKAVDGQVQALFMTAYATVGLAVEAMKLGAYDFLTKPFPAEHLVLKVKRLEEHLRTKRELKEAKERATKGTFHGILGACPKMLTLFEMTKTAARGDATVLILGESGTGKELLAKALHEESERRAEPFVPVHLASIPESLMESELFGHEKGAFTGATHRRAGRFETVGRGTLFLDDIDTASFPIQAKLLRVLQEREFYRIGSEAPIPFSGRIVASAKPHLRELVEKGAFREDLYFRLNVIPLEIPPLRERREDIPVLANYFLARYAPKVGKSIQGFDRDALEALKRYSFPGNVRELEHTVERAIYFVEDERITLKDLPPEVSQSAKAISSLDELKRLLAHLDKERVPFKGFLEAAEGAYFEWAMQQAKDNLSEAARRLGIPRTTLRDKLRRRPQ